MAKKQWHPWAWLQYNILTFKEAKALHRQLERGVRLGEADRPLSQFRLGKRVESIPTDDPFTFEERFLGWGVKVRRNLKDDL